MSLRDYHRSQELASEQFYALLMAAMRTADTPNQTRLEAAFPYVWDELRERYHAPGGRLLLDGQEVTP